MLRLCSYLVCENNSSKGFITQNMTKIGAFFKFLDLGPKFWNFVKNAPILLIFGVIKPFDELFSHTKYEPNRSIFDNVQKGMVLNWISRVIGDYFWLFNTGFWFWWLLHILAYPIHPVEASNLNILVKKFPKMGKFWQKSGHEKYFHTYWRMVMGSHQNGWIKGNTSNRP